MLRPPSKRGSDRASHRTGLVGVEVVEGMWPLRYQEPITRRLHLPYKPLEPTLSDEKLFLGIVLAQNLSRTSAYCRSEKKMAAEEGN